MPKKSSKSSKSPKTSKPKKLTIAERFSTQSLSEIVKGLSEKSLRTLLSFTRRAHTLRMREFEKVGMQSYANIAFEREGGRVQQKPSTMSRNQIIGELAREHSFFQSATSTVEGAKKIEAEIKSRFEESYGVDTSSWSSDDWTKFWDVYNEFMRSNPDWAGIQWSNDVQEVIAEEFQRLKNDTDTNISEILDNTRTRLRAKFDPLSLTPEEEANINYYGIRDD